MVNFNNDTTHSFLSKFLSLYFLGCKEGSSSRNVLYPAYQAECCMWWRRPQYEMSKRNKGNNWWCCKDYLIVALLQISIQLVQYGRLTPDDQVCAANIRYPVTSLSQGEREEKCLILEAIRTVEERCHGRESCTITASPDTLAKDLRDPCPLVR